MTWPPDELTFFIDRSLGRHIVPDALRDAGLIVIHHDELFQLDTPDTEWLPVVGREGWVVLMGDKRIRRNPMEDRALRAAGVRAFVLTSGHVTGPEKARILVRHARRIVHLARNEPAPFIAGVTRSGVRVYRW